MTALHKIPPAQPAKSTTHTRSQAGHDWSSGPWKYPPQEKRPWLESDLAQMIATAVVVLLILWAADSVWTSLTMPVGVVFE